MVNEVVKKPDKHGTNRLCKWCRHRSCSVGRATARRTAAPKRCHYKTCRSSTRGTPRALFGNIGLMEPQIGGLNPHSPDGEVSFRLWGDSAIIINKLCSI